MACCDRRWWVAGRAGARASVRRRRSTPSGARALLKPRCRCLAAATAAAALQPCRMSCSPPTAPGGPLVHPAQLAQQAADLRQAQREGWIPAQAGLGMLLPCFAPADGRSEGVSEGRPGRTLSTATSGLSAMSTDDGSGELAAAAAAALASQEERAAAEAAAEAARQARREQRRAEKEARRQKLLQVRPVRAGKGGSAAQLLFWCHAGRGVWPRCRLADCAALPHGPAGKEGGQGASTGGGAEALRRPAAALGGGGGRQAAAGG